jgi:hypothetical protein
MGRDTNNAFDLVHGLVCRPERLRCRIAVTSAQHDGSTPPVGMPGAFRASCGASFVVDLAQWKVPDRVQLRHAFTDLHGVGIVCLVWRHVREVA